MKSVSSISKDPNSFPLHNTSPKARLTLVSRLSVENGISSLSSVPFLVNSCGSVGSGGVGVTALGSGGGSGLFGGLALNLLRVTVEEEVGEDVPALGTGRAAGNLALDTENFTAEEVPDETDRVARLVVGGDGNVDEFERGVGVAERDDPGEVSYACSKDNVVLSSSPMAWRRFVASFHCHPTPP